MPSGATAVRRRAPAHRHLRPPWWRARLLPPARHATRNDAMLRFTTITALALIPGAGLVAIGRRVTGTVLLVGCSLASSVLAYHALMGDPRATVLGLAVRPRALLLVAVAVIVVSLVWCASIAVTSWAVRPRHAGVLQRALASAFVAIVVLAVAAPSAVATRYVLIHRDVVQTLFADDSPVPRKGIAAPSRQKDPWAGTPRVNVLLLGSDAGRNRTGVRTDSMIVASIDTSTGRTVLFGLPRSLQNAPFPAGHPLHAVWPNGFDCGDPCLLNGVWEQAEHRKELFPGDPDPGLTTTRAVIGEILGLRIDYYTMLDLRGFSGVVDAMGGVIVNVPRPIPIGGGKNATTGAQLPIDRYIQPGLRRLTGFEALWFARSREGSTDYDRMKRQRCLVGALLDQSNPVSLLASYPRLAAVLKNNLRTDVPRGDLAAWVTLVERVQRGGVTSLPFTNEVIDTVNPSYPRIRAIVQRALTAPPKATTQPATPKPTTTTTAKPPATPKPSQTNRPAVVEAEAISATC